jgi:hypothetical protein
LATKGLRAVSAAGAVAALAGAGTGAYIMLIAIQGVGNHLGRIVLFVPSFVAIAVIASAAGAIVRGSTRRVALLALAVGGFGALGSLWIWINLFIPLPGLLLLLAAGLAAAALVGAIRNTRNQLAAFLSVALGVGAAFVILVAGLTISVAPGCGSAGSSFHIDKWSRPAATVYVCGDGRLNFEFMQ